MITLAFALSALLAGILLWAGLEKSRDLAPLASTMHAIGVPLMFVRPAAWLLVSAEIAIAAGLVFTPDSVLTQVGIVALAVAFALAGMAAKLRGGLIHCSCFGGMNGRLGLTQVVALGPWLGCLAVIHLGAIERLAFSTGAVRFCVLGLTIAGIKAITVWRARCEARGDRLCAMEMFVWPR